MVDEIFPVDADTVLAASRMLERTPGLSARDALHVAIMRRNGIDDVLTFDTGFEAITGLRRIPG